MNDSSFRPSVWIEQLPTLEKLLWGGALVLLVDHALHGELFTFNLMELIRVGFPMSAVVTAVWAVMTFKKTLKRA